MDWRQLWDIASAPDNVPIVALIPLLVFYIYLAWKQAKANDDLTDELTQDAALAKTHHRKTWPFNPGWAKEVHVWPFLLRIDEVRIVAEAFRIILFGKEVHFTFF